MEKEDETIRKEIIEISHLGAKASRKSQASALRL